MSLTLSVKSNEPVDIWSIENKEEKKTTEDTLDNDVQQSINNLTNSKEDEIAIEQDTIEINITTFLEMYEIVINFEFPDISDQLKYSL